MWLRLETKTITNYKLRITNYGIMNRQEEELRKLILKVTSNDVLFPAIVTSVNYDEDYCDITADGEYTDVNLRAVIDSLGNRIVIYPKVDSVILCGRITNSNSIYVVQVSEIDKVVLVIGNTNVVLDENGIVFNNGLNTISKADVLHQELDKMSARIDGVIKALKNAAADSAGGTFKASLTPLLAAITVKEDFGDIEDEKIKH